MPPHGPPPPSYPAPSNRAPYDNIPNPTSGKRRALLIGCTYPGSEAPLYGCINDVLCMEYLLTTRFGYQRADIRILRDDVNDPDTRPTKANIMKGIQWLAANVSAGDHLFFHFSGHGSQVKDQDGDEEDGYDETLCPCDYKEAGEIVDDDLNRKLVFPLLPGVTLHAVIDACHSGTALDLPFMWKKSRPKLLGFIRKAEDGWTGQWNPSKATYGGTAIQIGACKDRQVALDAAELAKDGAAGAATFSFIEAIETYGTQQTYGQLLDHMTEVLEGLGEVDDNERFGAKMVAEGLRLGHSLLPKFGVLRDVAAHADGVRRASALQVPMLCCDRQLDLYKTKIDI